MQQAWCDGRADSKERNGGLKMNDWRIRKAQLGDADAMASCIDAAYARYADRIADLPPVSAGCAVDIAKKWVWVAVSGDGTGDEIIAGLFLAPGDGFMTLANMAVHPDHAGKGGGPRAHGTGRERGQKARFR